MCNWGACSTPPRESYFSFTSPLTEDAQAISLSYQYNQSMRRLHPHELQYNRSQEPYTPVQNGVAERSNRTLHDMANSLMIHCGAPPSFWAEAVCTATYLRNRAPTSALDGRGRKEQPQRPGVVWVINARVRRVETQRGEPRPIVAGGEET